MTLQKEISYEKEVLEHLKKLGCPENKIREDLLKIQGKYSKQLYEKAKRICEQCEQDYKRNYE